MQKKVFISGGAGGIGSAIALEFAKNGYIVVINYNTSDPSGILAEVQKYSPNSIAIQGDLSDYSSAGRVFADVFETVGDIDCLVNNAGVSYIGLFNTMQPEHWQKIINSNMNTMINCSHIAIQGMLQRHSGCIINISSMWGEVGASCEVIYSATKGAMDSFTRALAKETAPNGIRVNAVACGVIDTEMNNHLTDDERLALTEEIPMMRYGTAEEVAKAVFFLADNENSSYITGEILRVNGGMI